MGSTPTVGVTASGPSTATVFDFTFGMPAPVTTDSMYAVGGAQTVATATEIPLVQGAAPAGTSLTFAANAITVPAGTYMVSYGASGTNATGTSLSVQLYDADAPVAGTIVTDEAGAAASGSVSRTMLYTTADSAELSIFNVTADSVNLTDAYLTVVRIA